MQRAPYFPRRVRKGGPCRGTASAAGEARGVCLCGAGDLPTSLSPSTMPLTSTSRNGTLPERHSPCMMAAIEWRSSGDRCALEKGGSFMRRSIRIHAPPSNGVDSTAGAAGCGAAGG